METRDQFFEIDRNSTMEALAEYGGQFAYLQRGVAWWIGDLARYAEARWPEEWHQVFPEWISPGLVDRCKGVAKAYSNESDRNPLCTWTQHMQLAGKPNRHALLADIVSKGQTSDESRKAMQQERAQQNAADEALSATRWLLAVDVNYFLHRFWYSGAGVEAAKQVCDWVGRMVERLKEKGLTDCVCCFDSPNNFRKALTAEWEDGYKPRPPKEPELIQQLQLVRDLLHDAGFRCVAIDTFEADDVMASYAIQFDGRVTILSQDKDLKQCLSNNVNMLLDVTWNEDPTSGEMLPEYHWYSVKQHMDTTGLSPKQWAEYQAIWGDNVDGIKGAPGIGEKGAKDLMIEFGTLDAVIEHAWSEELRSLECWHPTWAPGRQKLKPKKREALLQLASQLDVVRQLVTLRTNLPVPMDTRA